MRLTPLLLAASLAFIAAPAMAQDADTAAPADAEVNIDLDLSEEAEGEIDALAEDFSIVMQTMSARILTVRMDPVLSEDEKTVQAAAIQAEYQPQIDDFTVAIGDIVRDQMIAEGGSPEEAAAQAGLIGSIVSAAVLLSSMDEPDPAVIAQIEAAAAQLEGTGTDGGEVDEAEIDEE